MACSDEISRQAFFWCQADCCPRFFDISGITISPGKCSSAAKMIYRQTLYYIFSGLLEFVIQFFCTFVPFTNQYQYEEIKISISPHR